MKYNIYIYSTTTTTTTKMPAKEESAIFTNLCTSTTITVKPGQAFP